MKPVDPLYCFLKKEDQLTSSVESSIQEFRTQPEGAQLDKMTNKINTWACILGAL